MALLNKVLIIRPVYGLCNQINSLVKGILLAHYSNRDLYIDQFQIDCNHKEKRNKIDIIYDLGKLQNILEFLKLQVKILDNLDIKNNPNIKKLIVQQENDYNKIDIEKYMKENEKESILDVENLSLYFDTNKHNLEETFNIIITNIPFHNRFIELSEKIMETFHLKNYVCLHLRLEDDCFDYMKNCLNDPNITKDQIIQIYQTQYEKELEELKQYKVKIYICTSLGIYSNKLNSYYIELKNKYNLIDKNDLINSFSVDTKIKCRELYGIIDFLIAKNANYFIGCEWSSFSILISKVHLFYNKRSKLLDLWQACKLETKKMKEKNHSNNSKNINNSNKSNNTFNSNKIKL